MEKDSRCCQKGQNHHQRHKVVTNTYRLQHLSPTLMMMKWFRKAVLTHCIISITQNLKTTLGYFNTSWSASFDLAFTSFSSIMHFSSSWCSRLFSILPSNDRPFILAIHRRISIASFLLPCLQSHLATVFKSALEATAISACKEWCNQWWLENYPWRFGNEKIVSRQAKQNQS